jgi:hypothetical protein
MFGSIKLMVLQISAMESGRSFSGQKLIQQQKSDMVFPMKLERRSQENSLEDLLPSRLWIKLIKFKRIRKHQEDASI